MKPVTLLAAIALLAAAGSSPAADWPQWRGPHRDGKSADKDLLKQWPEGGPPLAWRNDKLGGGDGAPAVAAGRIIGMGNRGDQEVVWALSEKDGGELWATPIGPAFRQRASQSKEGPGCTPTVDGERIYVEGMGGGVACLQAADGKLVWQRSLTEDLGGRVPMWSYRESPLVDGDRVIVTPGGPDALMAALDKATGKTVWKATLPDGPAGAAPPPEGRRPGRRGGFFGGPRRAGAAYASPVAIDLAGQRHYVQLTATALVGVAAADGGFLWRYDKPANSRAINCATPVFAGDMVFASSAYGAGGGAVRLNRGAGGAVRAEEVYATTEMQNHHGGMILLDGCLYGASGGNEGGALVCLDFKTGKVLWDQRKAGQRRAKGSLALADGLLYHRMEDGAVALVEPDPKRYSERSRFQQPDRTKAPAWAHPVVANGKLYLRDQDLLLCYDVKAK